MTDTTQAAWLPDERQMFEQWLSDNRYDSGKYGATHLMSGVYHNHTTRLYWEAWRGRAALAAQAVPATRRLTEADRVPDEYRNQARGYRAGWNDALSPAPAEAKPCEGANCGSTDGKSHSRECIAEAASIQGWEATEADFVNCPQPLAAQPVAFGEIHQDAQGVRSLRTETAQKLYSVPAGTKLYTAAAPALKEEQIDKMLHELDDLALAHGDNLPGLALNSRGLPGYRAIVRAALRSTQGGQP